VVVRDATVDDAEAIERIRIRGWKVAYRHVFPVEALDALEVDAAWWISYLREPAPKHRALVAEEEGALLGFATIGPSRDEAERYGELYGLYVDPDAWSRGIGRALLSRAEVELAGDWDEAVLWTLEENPRTRRFYEAAGWQTDGRRDSFDRLGIKAPVVRYRKRLTSSRSRS
jgi:ribosomal protein S18 acetylase RimI-like enzyme